MVAAKVILCIILCVESFLDIKKQQVWILLPVLAAGIGIWCSAQEKQISIKELFICICITMMLGGVSKISNEALGMGDVWIMGSILAVMGVMDGIGILFLSFLLAALYGGSLLMVKKAGRKKTFPFVPFLLLGTIGGVWIV